MAWVPFLGASWRSFGLVRPRFEDSAHYGVHQDPRASEDHHRHSALRLADSNG